MRRVLLVASFILLTLGSTVLAEETDWRELFLEHQRALVGCQDYQGFLAWMSQFGSKSNIEAFKKVDSRRITEIFERERALAERELAKPNAISIESEVTGDRATLRIKSREAMGIPKDDVVATRRLVREDGIWKVGD